MSEAATVLRPDEAAALVGLLVDLGEALKPLHVAGLAIVDAELPLELEELASRAAALGLGGAAARLGQLSAELGEVARSPEVSARRAAASRAWESLQRLVAWSRLLRAEIDLMTVEASLAPASGEASVAAPRRYPTASLDAWLHGLTWGHDGATLWYGQDVKTGRPVMLRDRLTELSPVDPVWSPAVSWLFQAQIVVGEVLEQVVRLKDHPIAEGRLAITFSPGLKALPTLVGRPRAAPPRPPALHLGREGELVWASGGDAVHAGLCGLIQARVRPGGGGVQIVDAEGDVVPLALSATTRGNLSRWLLREGAEQIETELVVLTGGAQPSTPLVVRASIEGRALISQDPWLFRLAPEALLKRAREAAPRLADPCRARLLEALAARLGGLPAAPAVTPVFAAPPTLTQLRDLLLAGDAVPAPDALAVARAVLARAGGAEADPALLARGVGAGGGAERVPDGAALLAALQVVLALDADDAALPGLAQAALEAIYNDPGLRLSVADVCARSLLIALAPSEASGGVRRALETFIALRDDLLPGVVKRKAAAGAELRLGDAAALVWATWALRLLAGDAPAEQEGAPPLPTLEPWELDAETTCRALEAARAGLARPALATPEAAERALEALLLLDLLQRAEVLVG